MGRRGTVAIALAALAALGLFAGGCGEEGAEEPAVGPAEKAEEVPQLPRGWSVHRNSDAGFELGVPPGWDARARGIRSTLRSPDRLVAATIFADRSNEAVELPLNDFAQAAIAGIGGFDELESGEVRRFDHRYDAVAIEATGVERDSGVEQELLLVVVRREELATFTVLVARNAERDTGRYRDQIERMIRSLRSRPVV